MMRHPVTPPKHPGYQQTAQLGLFTALASILGYIETLFPVFAGIPGIKLGLANLAVLFILVRYSWQKAALVSIARIIIIGAMFGSMFSILYSTAGAALSLAAMTLVLARTDFSIITVSVIGGVTHNIGQLLIAMALMETGSLIYYAPALLISGVVTGILIGALTGELLKRLR
ncbi:MAG: Gx transporter family protein [Lachnospiraceae bacterium]